MSKLLASLNINIYNYMSKEEELAIDITTDPTDEVIDITSADDTAADEQDSDEDGQEDDTTTSNEKKPTKSNKSNFKKMSKSNKAKDKRIQDLEAKLAAQDEGDDDDDEEDNDSPSYEKVDLLEFLTETEGANKFKEGIKEALDEFPWISFEKALRLAKIDWPEESTSYNNFKTKGSKNVKSKKIKDLSREEAVTKLTTAQFDVWQKSQKAGSDNPFG